MSVTANLTTNVETITATIVVEDETIIAEINTAARGPAGADGSGTNSITSATTSDGTANLSLSNVSTATVTITGMSVAPTASTTTSTTQLATTAFVQQELASGVAVAKNLEFLAHNGTGVTITKGSIVYINGAVSGNPRITLAQANNDTNSARTIGFAKADIANGANGFVISEGELENVSTVDAGGIIGAGNQIFLSPTTPGAFTRTEPSAPNHLVYVGVITRASTGANLDGRILVGIQNGYELDELHDVAISSPAAKQVVKRNAGNTLWVNEAIVSADVSDATSAGTANTLVRRDASGGANFAGTLNANGNAAFYGIVDFQTEDFTYGPFAAEAHRIALGGVSDGSTGAALFLAADAAAANSVLGVVSKRKATQTDRNNSGTGSTYTTDGDFTIPVTAGRTYRVEFAIYTTATSASGFKAQFTIPSVPSNITASANGVGLTSQPGAAIVALAMTTGGVIGTAALTRGTSATNGTYHGFFEVTIGTAGGNLLFQWAQVSASADNTSVLANSSVTAIERTP
jgi:hypothetical protein